MSQVARTGREILVEWANQQDGWVRAIVGEILSTRKALSDEKATLVYAMFLSEKELGDGTSSFSPQLSVGEENGAEAEDLRLTQIKDVQNVNALVTGQEISLNSGITVLFGENASGKSGYARILKRMAAVRSAEPILGDIRRSTATEDPCATIGFEVGSEEGSLVWANEAGVPPFTRMSVFDARAVSLYLDEDLTYLYTPGDLALFRFTHEAIESIKERLEQQRRETEPRGNPFLSRFGRETSVYPKVEALGPSTDLASLKELADVSASEEAGLESFRDKVEALRPQAVTSRLQLARSDRELLEVVTSVAQAMQSFDWNAYNSALRDAQQARERYENVSERAFADEGIPAVLTGEWRSFVEAGEEYLKALGIEQYPSEEEHCIFCRQKLDRAAVGLLTKYREFCSNTFKREVDATERDVQEKSQGITSISTEALERGLESRVTAADPEDLPPVIQRSKGLAEAVQAVKAELTLGKTLDLDAQQKLAAEAQELAGSALTSTKELIDSLQQKAEARQAAFTETLSKLRDLEARLTLRDILPEIESFVERAVWSNKAGTIITSRFPVTLRSLTEASKVASERLLNQDFERLFQEECEALRAPSVKLHFPGRRGQAARRKFIDADHRLSEILSEGEQNVIALADFLAEACLRTSSAPIVFDDPISSLDYKRLRYVADRITQLSEHNQIIVFTHNIWFAAELLARFDDTRDKCSFYEVSEGDGGVGKVTAGSHPRWDTVKRLKGKINSLIQDAGNNEGETQAALVEKAYDTIRAWCEVVVETELFAGVAQRYTPHVAMTQLRKINYDGLPDAISVVLPLFEKACRVMGGHSQPLETLGSRPTLDDLKEDWEKLQSARTSYLGD